MDHLKSLKKIGETKHFLGAEFLTWLWYFSEAKDGSHKIDIPQANRPVKFDIWVDDSVTLESHRSQVHSHTLKGGSPGESLEASVALRTGKLVKQARFGAHIDKVGDFLFTLHSKDLSLRTVHLPEIDDDAVDSRIEGRLEKIEILTQLIDHLFRQFIQDRKNETWIDSGEKKFKAWIEEKKTNHFQALS